MSCTHVGEVGMSAAEDSEILEWARVRNVVVVTLDADFHTLLMLRNAIQPSVIRLRLQGLNGMAVTDLLRQVVDRYAIELTAGCMITVKRRKMTCQLLTRNE
ncbi:MAG: DUF5615 family PIN-like protein [Bryobacteraceae bacterium]